MKDSLLKKPAPISKLAQMNLEKLIYFTEKKKLQDKDYPWTYSNFGIAF